MSESHLPEDPGLTPESWRPKFYGLIQDGRKSRISQGALKILFLFIGLIVLGSQILISWKVDTPQVKQEAFKTPSVSGIQENIYVPPVTSAIKELQEEKNLRQARRTPQKTSKIEPIKAINLSQVKEIPSGAEAMAFLSSGASNGLVKAVLSENLKYDGDILLKKGTTLIGKGSSSEDRLYISFSKAVSTDKTHLKIKAFAFDKSDRILGLKGKKISDYAFKLAASAGLIFLGGVADSYRNDYSSNPFEQRRPTLKDSALAGASTAAVTTGKDAMNDLENRQARMEVPSATNILVIFGDTE